MRRSFASGLMVAALRVALPGRSIQTRTASPSARRVPAAADVASSPLRKTFPRSRAVRARPRDPRRSGAARNLSSLVPASGAATAQCESDMPYYHAATDAGTACLARLARRTPLAERWPFLHARAIGKRVAGMQHHARAFADA